MPRTTQSYPDAGASSSAVGGAWSWTSVTGSGYPAVMATTRTPPEGSPEIDADQRASLDQYVTELSQLGTPPTTDPGPTGPKPVTDAQWDAMTDRARESWVRQLVDARLDDLSRDDEIA